MRRTRSPFLGLLALLALPARSPAQTPARTAVDTARIDSLVHANMTARHLVGVSIGILRDGQIIFVRGYGTANLRTHAAVDTTTRFAIGSVTKQFTSAIILQLAAEGRLSVDDRVAKYFPDLTRAGDITLRDLMGHVSGYPDYYPLDFVDRRMLRPISADSLARWYGHAPLDFEPGTRWSYSNTGFIMLGRIAELVAGRPLGRLMHERIFDPLGMRHTAYEPARRDRAYAQGYASFALGDPEPADPEASGWAAAAGGILSTPTDLLLWDRALMDGQVVGGENYRMMTTPRRLANGASTNYGFGLSIGVSGGDTILSHGGAVSGFAAQNTMVPSSRSGVVVLSNAEATINSGALLRMNITLRPAPPRDTTRAAAPAPTGDPRPVPDIQGPPAVEQAGSLLRQLQAGHVDRALLGEEFSWWLTDAMVRGAAARLAPLGEPTARAPLSRGERGGMEVTVTRFTFATRTLNALMDRTPDGKVQQLFIGAP